MVLEARAPSSRQNSGSVVCRVRAALRRLLPSSASPASLTLAKEQITDARIALTGVSDKPWRERWIEEILIGKKRRRIYSTKRPAKSPPTSTQARTSTVARPIGSRWRMS